MRGPELAIIVPTFNERSIIPHVITAVGDALGDVHWEIVFVDDNSPDGTADLARQLGREDARVRCMHRFGRRGFSSACVDGIMATAAPYVAVMNVDRRYDKSALRRMFELLRFGDAEIVLASLCADGEDTGDWNRSRTAISRFVARVANYITREPLTDPMSGFFMFRHETFLRALPKLSSIGDALLLDIFASSPRPLNVTEVSCQCTSPVNTESPPTSLVLWDCFLLLLDKVVGRYIPIRFISFALIGGSGVVVHFTVLSLLFKALGTSFAAAQIGATMTAMTSNFFLNNALTYRDQRLRGKNLFVGWISFNLVCTTGAIANVGIANWLFANQTFWVASALAGIAVGAVWNYTMSSAFTWKT